MQNSRDLEHFLRIVSLDSKKGDQNKKNWKKFGCYVNTHHFANT